MNRSYNHIKRLVDNIEAVKSNKHRPGPGCPELRWHQVREKQGANQLDDKQCHTGFNYYEYDMPKFSTPSRAQNSLDRCLRSPNFQEHLEDPEHDQARHQAIHGHGRS